MELEKEKKKRNYLRVIWVSSLYLFLIGVLILVIIFKVKYER